jgi:hypothetical protein
MLAGRQIRVPFNSIVALVLLSCLGCSSSQPETERNAKENRSTPNPLSIATDDSQALDRQVDSASGSEASVKLEKEQMMRDALDRMRGSNSDRTDPPTNSSDEKPKATDVAKIETAMPQPPLPEEGAGNNRQTTADLTGDEFADLVHDYLQDWKRRFEARTANPVADTSRPPMMRLSKSSDWHPESSGLPSHQLRLIASILSEAPGDWNEFRWCPPLKRPMMYLRIGYGVNSAQGTGESRDRHGLTLDQRRMLSKDELKKMGYSEKDLVPQEKDSLLLPGSSQLLEFTMEWPGSRTKALVTGKGPGEKAFGTYADAVAIAEEINRIAEERLVDITPEMRKQAQEEQELGRVSNSRIAWEAKTSVRSRMTKNVSDRYMPRHPVLSDSLKQYGGEFACLIIDRMNSVAHTAFGMSVVPPSSEVTTLAETEDAMKMAYVGDEVERDSVFLDLGYGSTDEILKKARGQQLDLLIIFDLKSEETKLSTRDWAAVYADWSKEWPRPERFQIDSRSPVPEERQRAAHRAEEEKQERQAVGQLAREQSVMKTTVTPRVIDVQSGKLLGDTSTFSINNLDVEIHRITTGRFCYRMLKSLKKNGLYFSFEQYDPSRFQATLNETLQQGKLSKYQRENLAKLVEGPKSKIDPDPLVIGAWRFVSTLTNSFGLTGLPEELNSQNAERRAANLMNGKMTVADLAEIDFFRKQDLVNSDVFQKALVNLLGDEDKERFLSGGIVERANLLGKHCSQPERVLAEIKQLTASGTPVTFE